MFTYLLVVISLSIFAFAYQTSKLKCQKYHEDVADCENKALSLIVGGTMVEEDEFPHMALIGFGEKEPIYDCGGSLISEHYVLTAAHCTNSKENGPASTVILGMSNRTYEGKHRQKRKINKIILHPKYKKSEKYHDIALLELKSPIDITKYVRPACLNFQTNHLDKEIGVATGFGKTAFTDEVGSEQLNKVSLPILKNSICSPFFKNMRRSTMPEGLSDDMLCAGSLEGGKDTCQGDSGGPLHLFMEAPYCTYSIIGITSFGKFCGYAKSPAIYTNVYEYIPWIEKHVWGDEM